MFCVMRGELLGRMEKQHASCTTARKSIPAGALGFAQSLQRRMVSPATSVAAAILRVRFKFSLPQRRMVPPATAVAAAICRV